MKRLSVLFVMITTLFVLAACGSNEEVVKLINDEQEGVTLEVTYTAEDDEVTKQTSKNEIFYDRLGVDNKEEAKEVELLQQAEAQYSQVDGITYKQDFKDDKVIEEIVVDYSKFDVNELEDLMGTMSSGDLENGVSLEGSIQLLESSGYRIVE